MQRFKKLLVVIPAEMKALHGLRRHGVELDVIEVVEETPLYAGRWGEGKRLETQGRSAS